MSQEGRRNQGMPPGVVLRPVAMLVAGVAASALLWHVLMLGPGPRVGQELGVERLAHGHRAALERLLKRHHQTP